MDIVKKTVAEIKAIKIQGASRVRESTVKALLISTQKSKAKTAEHFRKDFLKNCELLFHSRPTEPEMRTAIRVLKKSISKKDLSLKELKENVIKAAKNYEKNRKRALQEMTRYGSAMIKPHSTIMTICHSRTVVDAIIKAKKKINLVYCLETRPLLQGRITARELSDAGLKVVLLVDNAASTVMKDCDYFFSGADAFLADGDAINKIGTSQISMLCKRFDVKHYVFCSTHKFEPSTFYGKNEPIEERNVEEIWSTKEKKPKKVRIMNPAFDRTDSSKIEGIVTEMGIMPPQVLAAKLYEKLGLEKHHKDFLKL